MEYPASIDVRTPDQVARWRPLVQWILAIPHLIIGGALQYVAQAGEPAQDVAPMSTGAAQVPGAGGSLLRPLNSRAMRTRSAGAVVSALRMAMRSRGMPWATRISRSHWWVAVGSQKMMWPQFGLDATRFAHSTNFGLL